MCLLQILLQQKGEWRHFAVVVGWHIPKKLTPEIIAATIILATEWIPKQSVTRLPRDNLKCTWHTYTKLAI